jgi:rubrerythrin
VSFSKTYLFKQFITLFLLIITWEAHSQVILEERVEDIVLSPHNAQFDAPPFRKDSLRYWIAATVENKSNKLYLLECLSPHLRDVEVYILEGSVVIQKYETGSNFSFADRGLKHKNFLFPLPNEQGTYTLWIGLKNYNGVNLDLKIRTYSFFTEYALTEYFFLGLYYGTLVIVFFYNLFLYIKGRLRLHLLYSLYIIGCLVNSFKEDGIAYQFLWSGYPGFNHLMIAHIAQPLFLITFVAYALSFLKIQEYLPRLVRPLKALVVVFILLSLANSEAFTVAAEWVYFSTFLLVYFASLWIAQKGYTFAWYFFAGFSMVVASVLINALRLMDLFPSNILTVYTFNFGIFLEVIIFSIALAESIRRTGEERDRSKQGLIDQLRINDQLQKDLIRELEEKKQLQEKVNRELEERVALRTHELNEANVQLQAFSKKMEEISSQLDKHNYQLRKEISLEKISRVHEREVSYAEFLKIYASDEVCLQLLSNLKWSQGFVCRKCGYEKTVSNNLPSKKKCSRCGYIESVTANTLYHHLKFPVYKAFYLTYVEFAGLKYTNEQLSETIELRKSTLWAFRNKVIERMKLREYKNLQNWQDMIVDK